jgi:lipopolysaccharide/colanic/teichoic acid biosynthesis glycosyltransferase
VELIGLFFIAVLGIIGAAVSRQLTDEFKAWTPWLIDYLIQRAVRQLPENQRTLREEEWRSHINQIPGEVGKLIEALDFSRASWKMSRRLTDDTAYLVAKRAFDIAIGAGFLFALSPKFLVLAVFIRLTTDGPIVVIAKRRGYKGNTIRLLRFRTTTAAEEGPTLAEGRHHDLRVTPVGRFMLRLSLDGLPQVLNVLSGEMSLVGPRPLLSSELELIDKELPSLSRRKNVKPGLYG